MKNTRDELIKIAYENPELRTGLLPVILKMALKVSPQAIKTSMGQFESLITDAVNTQFLPMADLSKLKGLGENILKLKIQSDRDSTTDAAKISEFRGQFMALKGDLKRRGLVVDYQDISGSEWPQINKKKEAIKAQLNSIGNQIDAQIKHIFPGVKTTDIKLEGEEKELFMGLDHLKRKCQDMFHTHSRNLEGHFSRVAFHISPLYKALSKEMQGCWDLLSQPWGPPENNENVVWFADYNKQVDETHKAYMKLMGEIEKWNKIDADKINN